MKTQAFNVPKVGGGRAIMVVCANGWVDWPIRYSDGTIAYDAPEKVPRFIRPIVARMFNKIRDCNK